MRRADRSGRGGEAWDVTAARRATSTAVVSAWVIRAATSARPLWPWYFAVAIALDARVGAAPMEKLGPGCSHELAVLTLNPRTFAPRIIDPRRDHVYPLTDPEPDSISCECIRPPEVACQIEGESDVVAEMAIGQLVTDIVLIGHAPTAGAPEWNARVSRAVVAAHRIAAGALQESNALPN